jgi:hypothetical protein
MIAGGVLVNVKTTGTRVGKTQNRYVVSSACSMRAVCLAADVLHVWPQSSVHTTAGAHACIEWSWRGRSAVTHIPPGREVTGNCTVLYATTCMPEGRRRVLRSCAGR